MLKPEELRALKGARIEISDRAKEAVLRCRAYLDRFEGDGRDPVYGINTGFGALYNTTIPAGSLSELQRNLLISHACGMGEEVPADVVRLMLALKIKGLCFGHSGVQWETVDRLRFFLENDVLPIVYTLGSLGASGDLAPLAHLSLPLIGEGEVQWNGRRMPAAEALKALGIEPLTLKSKEGLALINGTQFMSAYATWCVLQARTIVNQGMGIAAMSLEAFDGRPEPFDPLTHQVRPHSGQMQAADSMAEWLEGSEIIQQPKKHVQDPYSFRCIPQVHGASIDALEYVERVVTIEINSVTDNPIVFPEQDKIISGGNFHGQPLAMVLELLGMAVAELGSISERRIYKLISGQRGLPAFLAPDAGLNSGFMIPQYTAASIVSQNKQLCTPAVVDTIDSSNGQEDHVSMGANGATKCFRIVSNVRRILAIEALAAAQGLEFRRPLKSSPKVEGLCAQVRTVAPYLPVDAYMHPLMGAVEQELFH